jgi:hypothetical protein
MTVGELFESLTTRLTEAQTEPAEDIFSAVGIVSDYLATRLFLMESQLLRTVITLNFPTGVSTVFMPDGILGTIEPPFTIESDKGTDNLTSLPIGSRARQTGETGQPRFYELIGRRFYVYPVPDQTYTVRFEGSKRPDRPTALTDDIPYDGLFDYVFREVVLLVMMNGGGAVATADAYLKENFDNLDKNRAKRTARFRMVI